VHHCATLSGYIFLTCLCNWVTYWQSEKIVKQQYLIHMSP